MYSNACPQEFIFPDPATDEFVRLNNQLEARRAVLKNELDAVKVDYAKCDQDSRIQRGSYESERANLVRGLMTLMASIQTTTQQNDQLAQTVFQLRTGGPMNQGVGFLEWLNRIGAKNANAGPIISKLIGPNGKPFIRVRFPIKPERQVATFDGRAAAILLDAARIFAAKIDGSNRSSPGRGPSPGPGPSPGNGGSSSSDSSNSDSQPGGGGGAVLAYSGPISPAASGDGYSGFSRLFKTPDGGYVAADPYQSGSYLEDISLGSGPGGISVGSPAGGQISLGSGGGGGLPDHFQNISLGSGQGGIPLGSPAGGQISLGSGGGGGLPDNFQNISLGSGNPCAGQFDLGPQGSPGFQNNVGAANLSGGQGGIPVGSPAGGQISLGSGGGGGLPNSFQNISLGSGQGGIPVGSPAGGQISLGSGGGGGLPNNFQNISLGSGQGGTPVGSPAGGQISLGSGGGNFQNISLGSGQGGDPCGSPAGGQIPLGSGGGGALPDNFQNISLGSGQGGDPFGAPAAGQVDLGFGSPGPQNNVGPANISGGQGGNPFGIPAAGQVDIGFDGCGGLPNNFQNISLGNGQGGNPFGSPAAGGQVDLGFGSPGLVNNVGAVNPAQAGAGNSFVACDGDGFEDSFGPVRGPSALFSPSQGGVALPERRIFPRRGDNQKCLHKDLSNLDPVHVNANWTIDASRQGYFNNQSGLLQNSYGSYGADDRSNPIPWAPAPLQIDPPRNQMRIYGFDRDIHPEFAEAPSVGGRLNYTPSPVSVASFGGQFLSPGLQNSPQNAAVPTPSFFHGCPTHDNTHMMTRRLSPRNNPPITPLAFQELSTNNFNYSDFAGNVNLAGTPNVTPVCSPEGAVGPYQGLIPQIEIQQPTPPSPTWYNPADPSNFPWRDNFSPSYSEFAEDVSPGCYSNQSNLAQVSIGQEALGSSSGSPGSPFEIINLSNEGYGLNPNSGQGSPGNVSQADSAYGYYQDRSANAGSPAPSMSPEGARVGCCSNNSTGYPSSLSSFGYGNGFGRLSLSGNSAMGGPCAWPNVSRSPSPNPNTSTPFSDPNMTYLSESSDPSFSTQATDPNMTFYSSEESSCEPYSIYSDEGSAGESILTNSTVYSDADRSLAEATFANSRVNPGGSPNSTRNEDCD